MIIFLNILKRIMKNKIQAAVIILLPVIFVAIMAVTTNPRTSEINVGFIDRDNTEYTKILKDSIAGEMKIIDIEENSIEKMISSNKINYAIVIDSGFTNKMINGEDVNVKGYSMKDGMKAIPARMYIKNFLEVSKSIAQGSTGDKDKFYKGIKYFINEGIGMEYTKIADIDKDRSYNVLGLFTMFMMFTIMIYTTILLADKENMTFYRSIAAPVTLKSYMLQCILSFMAISLVQITILLIFMKFALGIYLGESFFKIYLVFLLASLSFISMGIAVSSIAKGVLQACFVGMFITLPMSFVGGCWWRNDYSTDLIKTAGRFTPVYWVMNGVTKMLNNMSLSDIKWELMFIIAFSAIFFIMGTWKREEIIA